MAINKELWLAPIAGASPCGENLEYDAEYLKLEQALQGKGEQQYGKTVIAAEEPDWRDIEHIAASLLARSKDIRICLPLIRAYVHNNGLVGLADGLAGLLEVLNTYWDQVHPMLIIDGDDDPLVRGNALAALTDASGLVRDIRQAVLLKSAIGNVLVKDAEMTLESVQGVELTYGREQLMAIFADPQVNGQASVQALIAADQSLKAIAALCDDRLGSEYTPDLALLATVISTVAKPLILQAKAAMEAAAPEEIVEAGAPVGEIAAAGTVSAAPRSSGMTDIRSRDDAVRVLDIVCKYIEKNEPTNPAPLLIRRALHLMTLDFLDIMKELAPDGVKQFEIIAGPRRE